MDIESIVWISLALFLLLDLALVGYVFWRKRHVRPDAETIRQVRQHWPSVTSRLESDPSGAVMDADKLLAHALQRIGYPGQMADKLRSAQARFSDVEALWRAHKLRNRVVHEVSVVVSPADARRAIRAYERALADLHLL